MRHILLALSLVPVDTPPTWDTALTQGELNRAAAVERKAAQERMEAELSRVLLAAKDDPAQVARVRSAHAAWEAYRSAQLEALYGCDDLRVHGSVAPMCMSIAETGLLTRRADELHGMLAGIAEEGDVCGWRPTCGD